MHEPASREAPAARPSARIIDRTDSSEKFVWGAPMTTRAQATAADETLTERQAFADLLGWAALARKMAKWFEERGYDVCDHRLAQVIATLKGTGGGKSLMH